MRPPKSPYEYMLAASRKREKAIAKDFADGVDMCALAIKHNVSRQRIQQILKKIGLGRTDGGQYVRVTPQKIDQERGASIRREARCQRLYGCDLVTFSRLNLGMKASATESPAKRFKDQKGNAKKRSIPWEMTFAEWATIWQESGKWEQRGLGLGKFCMARKMDTGPYRLGNVHIIKLEDNTREYQARLKVDGVRCDDGYLRLPENPFFEENV